LHTESESSVRQHPTATSAQTHLRQGTFGSLANRNFRLFLTGLLITGTGGWVQRIAQDWLVLSMTGSATAVGVTTMCQFLPTLLLGLIGGVIADRYPKRAVLLATQISMSIMAGTLAALTLSHQIRVWQIDLLALGIGAATAIDNPTRQAFATELVSPNQLRNAISMVSSIFQLGAMVGPAISGALISTVGSGYAFAANSVSYLGAIIMLARIRQPRLKHEPDHRTRQANLGRTFRYVVSSPSVLWPITLVGVFGLFTFSLPVTLAAIAKSTFHYGASGYGLFSSVVALGSVIGALVSARRSQPTRLRSLMLIAGSLAAAELAAGLATSVWLFAPCLFVLGGATLYFITSVQSMVQLATVPALRGRVLGIYLLVFLGSGALGGPLVGYLDSHLGARSGLVIAGLVSAFATFTLALNLARLGRLRLRIHPGASISQLASVVSR
jgi:MFS family permease